jgi:hypothetical protein
LAARASDRIDLIEFFGYQGLDADAVRKALPVAEGGVYDGKMTAAIREAVRRITGADATDIGAVCWAIPCSTLGWQGNPRGPSG